MSQQTVWIGEASLKAGSGTRHVIILAYATDREDFIRQVEAYFQETGDQGQFLLAPLDANTYFTRHGKVWLLSPIRTLGGTVKIIPLDEEPVHTREETDYLLRHEITDFTPLDDQAGRYPPRFAPDELFTLLWPHGEIPANRFDPDWQSWQPPTFAPPETDPAIDAKDNALFGEKLPPLNVYFLADGARLDHFPDLYANYRCESLYKGELAETYDEAAPYLLEVIPSQTSELAGLFHRRDTLPLPVSWDDQTGIFIHSRHGFATVYNHFRKLTYLPDESGEWIFFRPYDPKVLRRYLETIASHPDKLARFFGSDERIIHGLGSGVDESFIYYQIKDLGDARPARILLTQWEMDGMDAQMAQESKQKILAYLRQQHTELFANSDDNTLLQTMDQAIEHGYDSEISLMQYVVCKAQAQQQQLNFSAIVAQIGQQNTALELHP